MFLFRLISITPSMTDGPGNLSGSSCRNMGEALPERSPYKQTDFYMEFNGHESIVDLPEM